jgi:hypothetical protein
VTAKHSVRGKIVLMVHLGCPHIGWRPKTAPDREDDRNSPPSPSASDTAEMVR